MCGVSGNLVPQALRGNDGNLIANPLVGLEVERELGVVTLNDDLGGLLDGLRSDATHFGGGMRGWEGREEEAGGLVVKSLSKERIDVAKCVWTRPNC